MKKDYMTDTAENDLISSDNDLESNESKYAMLITILIRDYKEIFLTFLLSGST